MNAINLFNKAIEEWKNNRCVGTAIIPNTINDKILLLLILQKIYNKDEKSDVLIITKTYNERLELVNFFTNQEDKANNAEFKHIIDNRILRIYSENFVKDFATITNKTVIFYHIDILYGKYVDFLKATEFKLVVLNKILSIDDMSTLIKYAPILNCFKDNEIGEIRSSLPVEEMLVGVTIEDDTEESKLLKYYNEYITTTINILGSFENIAYAKSGNEKLNISSAQICSQIASNNGWNPNLDMSIEYNVELDKLYNPANIRERASNAYEIIRNRSRLLSDYKGKLEEISKIINENPTSKILIINKRSEFAAFVTEYINSNSSTEICANFHDFVEPMPLKDKNGNYIVYKSGAKAGEIRYMKADMQKTYNENRFKNNEIRVLSCGNSPDKDLDVEVDIIIVTSSQCLSLKEYLYRLRKLRFKSEPLKMYTLYINRSVEKNKLNLEPISENHTIRNNENNKNIEENFGNIIVD